MENKKESFITRTITENPVFVLYLGICSVLGVSTSLDNAIGMTLIVFIVLLFSNITISAIRKITPNEIRIPVYIIIIATLVTASEMFVKAYAPVLYSSLGTFIALVVVNCIILGRAEACASKSTILESIADAFVMSAGYGIAILAMSIIRSFLATGGWSFSNPLNMQPIFDLKILPAEFTIGLFGQPIGSFITFGILAAVFSALKERSDKKAKEGK
jgi:Predicted NADH:ubiquinone oxidoreductase, subunit RnfE